jgi:Na+-translocating ferredoxin:NAD+ oxidoreductase subunit B
MMGKGIAAIDYAACMACGVCVQVCPFGYLALQKIGIDPLDNAYAELTADHKCTGCGLCATACPLDCLSIQV